MLYLFIRIPDIYTLKNIYYYRAIIPYLISNGNFCNRVFVQIQIHNQLYETLILRPQKVSYVLNPDKEIREPHNLKKLNRAELSSISTSVIA